MISEQKLQHQLHLGRQFPGGDDDIAMVGGEEGPRQDAPLIQNGEHSADPIHADRRRTP